METPYQSFRWRIEMAYTLILHTDGKDSFSIEAKVSFADMQKLQKAGFASVKGKSERLCNMYRNQNAAVLRQWEVIVDGKWAVRGPVKE
jgi:hypothetical protein